MKTIFKTSYSFKASDAVIKRIQSICLFKSTNDASSWFYKYYTVFENQQKSLIFTPKLAFILCLYLHSQCCKMSLSNYDMTLNINFGFANI